MYTKLLHCFYIPGFSISGGPRIFTVRTGDKWEEVVEAEYVMEDIEVVVVMLDVNAA